MKPLRPLPTDKQVATVFRQLADDYSDELARGSKERTWQRIELKQRLTQRHSGWVRSRARTSVPRLFAYGMAALSVACLCVFLLWPEPESFGFTVTGAQLDNGWVNTKEESARLDFTDGSRLSVDEETSVHVNVLGEHSALTRLARGSVRVAVEHREHTNWTFLAGPYEVQVEGTTFDLSWQDERLQLSMLEGKVRVVGPDQQEWVLTQGEVLVTPQLEASVAETALPDRAKGDGVETEAEHVEQDATEADESSAVASRSPNGAWGKLLVDGRFGEIVAAAERRGVNRTLKTRSTSDLVALGQAARYVGKAKLAEDSWQAIRRRAPGSQSAQKAAFFMGRIMEQQGRSGDAIRWFARYREESPSGVYAGQALGRQLVLTAGQGKSARAMTLAREYLDRYASGPYASAARAALEDDAASADSDAAKR